MILERNSSTFHRLCKDKTGNFAVITALLAAPVLYAASLSVNISDAYQVSQHMQSALDAASIAALMKYEHTKDSAAAKTEAINVFEANFYKQTNQNLSGSTVASNLQVSVQVSGGQYAATSTYLLNHAPAFLPGPSFPISRESQAVASAVSQTSESCVLALSSDASRSIDASGATIVDMPSCIMVTNSNASDSIYAGGSASLTAQCLQAVGGIAIGTAQVTLNCGSGKAHALTVADPFYDLAMPTPATPAKSAVKTTGSGTVQLQPGTYKGMDLHGSVNFDPGQYIINGGSLTVNANTILTGSNVTFFLMNGASITVNGSATLNLTAATSGTWAGFLFVADRNNTSAAIINGNSTLQLSGIIYMPASQVTYSGSGSSGGGECVRVVADTVKFIGNSDIQSSCSTQLSGVKVSPFTMPYLSL